MFSAEYLLTNLTLIDISPNENSEGDQICKASFFDLNHVLQRGDYLGFPLIDFSFSRSRGTISQIHGLNKVPALYNVGYSLGGDYKHKTATKFTGSTLLSEFKFDFTGMSPNTFLLLNKRYYEIDKADICTLTFITNEILKDKKEKGYSFFKISLLDADYIKFHHIFNKVPGYYELDLFLSTEGKKNKVML